MIRLYCDRCNKLLEKPYEIYHINVFENDEDDTWPTFDVCEECVEDMGLTTMKVRLENE